MSRTSAGASSPGLERRPTRWADKLGPGSPVVAFDVAGTVIKCCLVDAEGGIVEIRRVPAPEPGPAAGGRGAEAKAPVIPGPPAPPPGPPPPPAGPVGA